MLSKEQLDKINYINLVAKTHYSIPFGVGKVKDQISSAAKKGHQGIAIVDDFAMNGILEAYSLSKDKDYIAKLKKENFSIILGTKINLTDNLELNDSSVFNISIYAKNWTGYKNMTYLTSLSSMPGNGFVNSESVLTKRISFENLAERSEGLIIGSGDIDGILSQSIIKGNGQEEDLIQIFKEIFGDSFFIEIHYHPKTKFWNKAAKSYQEQTDDVQKIVNLELIKLAKKHNVKCCLVQNSYMHDKKYDYIQNILISNHKDFKKDGYFIDVPKYMMTVEEMYQYVQRNASYISDEEFVEFCENSIYFADLCKNIYLEFEPALPYIDYKLHPVNLPENAEKYEKLFHEYWAKVGAICPAMGEIFKIAHVRNDEALKTSLKALIRLEKMEWENIEWLDRLAIEIKVLTRNGVLNLLDYFLLLEDVTNFLRDIGKLRGWGRGSGGGSLLTYVMDVSDVQPLKYNLLFERFFTQDKIGVQYHEIENYPLSEYSSGKLKDIDEVILELDNLKKLFNNKKLKDVNQESLHKELYYIECNDELIKYYQNVAKKTTTANIKLENKNDSTLAYLLDITDSLPKKFIKHSEPSMPDFDYDTDGRDEVKAYLTKKNGYKHTTLIGTLGSLKTKGAVKDVIRQLRPDMDVTKEVNPLTEKFNVIKTTDEEKIRDTLQLAMAQKNIDYSGIDFKSELAYFYACLEAEPKLNEWFSQNQNVKDAVVLLLGNAKGTGVHAGGIVVSRKEIMELCPLTWSYDENIWVTQYEMTYVEKAGLIKYDFLGLSTLQDFNRVLKLINSRYPEKIVLSKIPMDDKVIFDLFIQGKTESVFQFNGPLPISILTQLKEVRGIDDLALITSIARPGPLAMGMDRTFIKRNTGEEPVEYLHPSLEPILKETYGLIAYQESVLKISQEIGELPPPDSVKFMKALSKKKPEAVAKLIDKINKTATTKYHFKPEVAKELMDTMQAFSLYAFNKSHAAAYACVSYLCMWFKHYYPAEWISAVLSGAKKEDLEILYPKWKDYIVPPSINQSKDSFQINEDNKVVMPFNAVNGIGEKAVIEIIKKQPYASFEDFMNRVDLGVVNKTSVLAMIFTGIFDSFKPDEETSQRWRKILVRDYFKLKFALAEKRTGKKTSKKDIEEAKKFFEDEVVKMNRSAILMKEISLLNFTAFDYYDYYRREMTDGARVKFGKQAIRPGEVQKYPTDSTVVVGGMIEDIEFKRTKKGGEMAVLKLSNDGHTLDVMIFGRQIEEDDASESKMIRNLKKYMPIIIKGKVNRWNGRLSLVWGDAHILL